MSDSNSTVTVNSLQNPLKSRKLPALAAVLASMIPAACERANAGEAPIMPDVAAAAPRPVMPQDPKPAEYVVQRQSPPPAFQYPIDQPVGRVVKTVALLRDFGVVKDVLLVESAARPGAAGANEQEGALTQMWLSLYNEGTHLMSLGGKHRAFNAKYDITKDRFILEVYVANSMDCVDRAVAAELKPADKPTGRPCGTLDVEQSLLAASNPGDPQNIHAIAKHPSVRNQKELVYTFELTEPQYEQMKELIGSDNLMLNQIPQVWTEQNTKAASVVRIQVGRLQTFRSALSNRSVGKDANGLDIISTADTNDIQDRMQMEWTRDVISEGTEALMHLQPADELEALKILKTQAAKDPDTIRKLFQKFKENHYDALRNQYAAAKKEVADSNSSFEVIDQGTMTDEQKRHLDIQKTTETNASGHFFLFSAGGASKTTAGHVEDESITRVVNNFQKKTGLSLQHVENTNLYMPVQAEVNLMSSESAITEGMVKNRVTVVNGRMLQSIAPIQVNGSARNVVHRTAAEQGPQPEQELDQNRLQLRYQLKRVSERREADSKRVRKILSRLNEGMDKEIAGTFGKSIETSTGTIAPAFDRLHSQFQRSHGIQDFIYAGKPSEKSAAEPFSDSKATTLLSDYRGHLESLESLMKDIKQSLEVRESRSPGAEALRKFLKVELDWIEEAKQFYVFTPV